jgi:histidyl-tRNA synthetase
MRDDMNQTIQTLKGFRDFLPASAIKRNFVMGKMKDVFALYGFDPLETPALEYAETLLGKYGGEADKLLYLFEDNGKRKVGLRYDQTVPLSRVIAQYQNDLPIPFKRYQMQPVWRAENTKKGRYREFLQCDIDTIGSDDPLSDTEIIACTLKVLQNLGLTNVQCLINDRTIFDTGNFSKKEIVIIDKFDKIGRDGVINELKKIGVTDAERRLSVLEGAKPTERLARIIQQLEMQGFSNGKDFRFTPTIARGLDYYTSTIFEVKVLDGTSLSIAGGGRYDELIGQFSGTAMPAVGIAFGFDRLMECLDEKGLLPDISSSSKVLVTICTPDTLPENLITAETLRTKGVPTELYLNANAKLEKQLKYADKKGIPFVIIQGPEEVTNNTLQLKDMRLRTSKTVTINTLIDELK